MKLSEVRLALIFKDFAAWVRSSCVGLNVAGYTTAKVLRDHGIQTMVFPVRSNVDIVQALDAYNETHPDAPLTHVVISAPWLPVWDLKSLVENFPSTNFVILSHSNVGFLQADPDGVWNLRQYHELAGTHPNLKIGGNSEKFVRWLQHAYGKEAVLLPNLYPLSKNGMKDAWDGKSSLKIGAFGAVRPYKNFMTAAAAAVTLRRALGVPVEFHMSTGGEGGTVAAIEQMVGNVPDFKLVKHDWQYWDGFIRLVGEMDLLLQVSYTESFNLITADGIYAGVPSVVSDAIDWAPQEWKARADDAHHVAYVGLRLLRGEKRNLGLRALEDHNEESVKFWEAYLRGEIITFDPEFEPEPWHHKVRRHVRRFFGL